MKNQLNVIDSTLNNVGSDFNYRKKEILFDRFIKWFDKTEFILDNDKFMGWGEYISDCGTLRIRTACFDGGEWLRHVQHTSKANNPYNNVNAITYWDMLNEKGKAFFFDFYTPQIGSIRLNLHCKISDLQSQIDILNQKINDIDSEVDTLRPPINQIG